MNYGDETSGFGDMFRRKFNRGIGIPGQEGDFMGGPLPLPEEGPQGDTPPWGSGGNPGPMPLPPKDTGGWGGGGPMPVPDGGPSGWRGAPTGGLDFVGPGGGLGGPQGDVGWGGGAGPMPLPDPPIYNQMGVRMNEPPAKQWTQEGWQAELAKLQNPTTPQGNVMGGPVGFNTISPRGMDIIMPGPPQGGPIDRTPGGPAGPGGMRELPLKRRPFGAEQEDRGPLPRGPRNPRRPNTWGGDGQETQNPGGGGFNFTNQNRGLGNAQGEWKGWGNPDNLKIRKF